MKICRRCHTKKKESKFFINKTYTCGLMADCKECETEKEKIDGRKKRFQQTYKGVYWNYKGNAKHSNFEFKLTMEDFKNFEGQDCFYCGEKLLRVGLDRIDNNKGYTLDNINPCCSICNYMRRTQTQEEFINKCIQISERQSIKDVI